MPAIRIKNGPQRGTIHEIRDIGIVIGKTSEADIRLFDTKVEDFHARIYRMGEMYFLRNLAEEGFTYVNDEPVTEVMLREGDTIRIGSTIVVFDSSRATVRAVEESDYLLDDFLFDVNDEDVLNPSMDVPEGSSRLQRDLDVIRDFIKIGAEEKGVKQYLDKAVQFITEKIGCDYSTVVIRDEARNRTKIIASFSKAGDSVKVAEPIVNHAISKNRSLLIADAMGDKRFATHPGVKELDVHSVLCVPMRVRSETNGCLYLAYEEFNGVFSPEDLHIATIFGMQIGIVLGYLENFSRQTETIHSIVKALAKAVDLHDPLMMGHSERVGQFSKAIAEFMGLSGDEVSDIYLAGLLHDIGRIVQNDDIVETQRAINRGEVRPIIEHVEMGVNILSEIIGLEKIIPMVETHHEFFDGTGLPNKVKGTQIPIGGRILCAANIFDEFLYPIVPERNPHSPSSALIQLKLCAGNKLDPDIVNAFLIAYRKGALLPDKPSGDRRAGE